MAKILVIDDNNEFRKLMKEFLEKHGYQVDEAANGEEGLRVFRRSPADLVISGVIMPEKEGLETMLELRKDYPGVKIFAVSGGGFEGPDSYLPGAKLVGGAIKTFSKPFDLKDLLVAVEETLSGGGKKGHGK